MRGMPFTMNKVFRADLVKTNEKSVIIYPIYENRRFGYPILYSGNPNSIEEIVDILKNTNKILDDIRNNTELHHKFLSEVHFRARDYIFHDDI